MSFSWNLSCVKFRDLYAFHDTKPWVGSFWANIKHSHRKYWSFDFDIWINAYDLTIMFSWPMCQYIAIPFVCIFFCSEFFPHNSLNFSTHNLYLRWISIFVQNKWPFFRNESYFFIWNIYLYISQTLLSFNTHSHAATNLIHIIHKYMYESNKLR